MNVSKNFLVRLASGWLLVVFLTLAGCGGQNYDSAGSPAPTGKGGRVDVLRVGDTLTIRLSGVPDGGSISEEKIDEDGYVSMALIGRFKAAGQGPSQLKSQIEAAYREQKIYATPNVTIIVQGRFINVNGEVRAPQRVAYTNDLTAMGALASCGGFTDYAKKRDIRILRDGKVIPFDAVAAANNPTADVPLQAGDMIQVDRTIF